MATLLLEKAKRTLKHSILSIQLPVWMDSWRVKALVMVLVAVVGGAYIAETNSLATSGYVIHKLQNQIDAKATEIQKLESKVAGYQSMHSIQARLPGAQLVPADKISYISVARTSQVAER